MNGLGRESPLKFYRKSTDEIFRTPYPLFEFFYSNYQEINIKKIHFSLTGKIIN